MRTAATSAARCEGPEVTQLALNLEPEPGELAVVEWWRGLPDRSGMFDYVVLIRDQHDPERKKRGREAGDVKPHLTLRKTTAVDWAERIASHLSDGVPRTFNRIAVELVDKTADVVCDTPVEAGLWLLVEQERIEYTPAAPVFFRRVA